MPTNILDIVRQDLDFETRNNADWRDGWLIGGASTAIDVPDETNQGNGTIGTVAVAPLTPSSVLRVEISEIEGGATYFALRDLESAVLARGAVGAPFQAEGLTFTVSQGSTPFEVGDGFTVSVLNAPLDITGISFRLALRQTIESGGLYRPDLALKLSTTLSEAPNAFGSVLLNDGSSGIVSLQVPAAHMRAIKPGAYNYDLLAEADGHIVTAAVGTVEHVAGLA